MRGGSCQRPSVSPHRRPSVLPTGGRRKVIVEPLFGPMQTVQNARHLLLRGKDTARAQWRFHCAIHNLLKLQHAGGLALIPAA